MSFLLKPVEFFRVLAYVDRFYLVVLLAMVAASAVLCRRVQWTNQLGFRSQQLAIETGTRMLHLDSMFRIAVITAALFELDSLWNVCLVYMVLRATDANPEFAIHLAMEITVVVALLLLPLATINWVARVAAMRIDRDSA